MLNLLRNLFQRRWVRWLRDILIFCVLVLGIERYQAREMKKGSLPESLRTLSLPSPRGPTHSLWSPAQPTLVYIFAPWCGVCKISAGNLAKVSTSRFHVISLALSWESASDVEAFAEKTGLSVPILMGDERVASLLGISSYPSYLLIDKEGNIVRAWSGYTTTAGLLWKSFWAS